MLVRESIYESIKHLTPRSEEELKTNVKGLDLYQKIILGAKEGFLWAVKDAIREGADDYYKNEALLWAAFRGYDEIIKLLLNSGADIHYQKEHALYWAVRCEHAETIKLLLEKGAIITPTILDVAYHVNDEIKNLVQQEYDKSKHKKVNESIKHLTPRSEQELQTTMKNLSPKEKLDTGAEQGIIWLVKDAIAAGADVHARNDYALQNASYYGHAEMVKLLLNAGANVHARDDLALWWASNNGHAEVVKLLKRDVTKKVNESIKHLTPRSEDEMRQSIKDLSTLDKFLFGCKNNLDWVIREAVSEEHIDPSIKFEAGCTHKIDWLIKLALEEKDLSAHKLLNYGGSHKIDWLVKEGAKKAEPDQKLIAGYMYGITWLVKEALDEGADPTVQDNSAIRHASYAYYNEGDTTNLEIVKLLLKDPRVDPSTENNFALRHAIQANHYNVVKELLKDSRLNIEPRAAYTNFYSHIGSALLTWAPKNSPEGLKMIKLLLKDKRISSTLHAGDIIEYYGMF